MTSLDGIMEIVDRSHNQVVKGEKGFTICSTLHNFSMPLIRYALNDYTGIKNDECSCGRTLPLIFPVETKIEDFVVTPTGKIISPSIFTFPLKDMKNIIETQIIQKSIDELIVKIVKSEKFSVSDEKQFLDRFLAIVGNEMNVKIQYVDKIFQTGNFKKRFVVNEIDNYLGDIFEEN
jgi:phenylacetate-CoA ligase